MIERVPTRTSRFAGRATHLEFSAYDPPDFVQSRYWLDPEGEQGSANRQCGLIAKIEAHERQPLARAGGPGIALITKGQRLAQARWRLA